MSEGIPRSHYLTSQEMKFVGGSESEDGAKIGKPYTPLGLIYGIPDLGLERIRGARTEKKFFGSLLATVYINPDAVLSLEPLNDQGETERDPQILIYDERSDSLTADPDLTEKLYHKLKEREDRIREEYKREGINMPDWYYFSNHSRPAGSGLEGSVRREGSIL